MTQFEGNGGGFHGSRGTLGDMICFLQFLSIIFIHKIFRLGVVRAEFCSRPFRQSVQSLVIFCLDNLLFVVAVAVTFNRDVYILYILLGV